MSRRGATPYDDADRFDDLDDEERAEAMALEARHAEALRTAPPGPWLLSEIPMRPGTVLVCRSIWVGAAVVMLAISIFGAFVHQIDGIAVGGAVVALAMLAHGRGPARRIEVRGVGDVVIRGGLFGRTVALTDFTWAAAYESTARFPRVGRASTVVLHRDEGEHRLARVVAVLCPTVSRRRTVVVLSSLWRFSDGGQRIPDNTMSEFFRAACQDSGMRVTRWRGRNVFWTAARHGLP